MPKGQSNKARSLRVALILLLTWMFGAMIVRVRVTRDLKVQQHNTPPPRLSSKSPRNENGRPQNNKHSPMIPHTLFFTYSHDILKEKRPKLLYDNIQRTIDQYRRAWGEPEAPVKFLVDDDCRRYIREVDHELLSHFDNEPHGMFKADICRVAALYAEGGYYFDVDLEVIQPILLDDTVEFSSSESRGTTLESSEYRNKNKARSGDFFQAFLASKPESPILKETISVMKRFYTGQIEFGPNGSHVGPMTMRFAYDSIPAKAKRKALLLMQDNMDDFPELSRRVPRKKGTGCCCNYVVYNTQDQNAYFYARIAQPGNWKCAPL